MYGNVNEQMRSGWLNGSGRLISAERRCAVGFSRIVDGDGKD
jgi:hypothetical protein